MNWNKLIYYSFILINSLIIGMMLSAQLGFANGQGLASGAIIIGYGITFAIISFIISLYFGRKLTTYLIKMFNKYLILLFIFFLFLLLYRLFTI